VIPAAVAILWQVSPETAISHCQNPSCQAQSRKLTKVELVTVAHHPRLRRRRRANTIARRRRGRARRRSRKANDADANIVADIEARARRAHGGVPRIELAERDAELGGNGLALVARDDVVELVAARRHARLDPRGRRDAVALAGARRERRLPDDADADVVADVEVAAGRSDRRIPSVEL